MLENDSTPKSWRDVIKVHPAADMFPMMSDAELEVLSKDIAKHGLNSKVTLWRETDDSRDVVLLDGRNRLDAMERAGLEVELPDGEINLFNGDECLSLVLPSKVDPYEHVIAANIHRRHLTPEQRRDVVAKLLKTEPARSNRAIGKIAKVDHVTVGSVREKLEATGEIHQLEKTVGSDGKERPSRATSKLVEPPVQAGLEEFTPQAEVGSIGSVDGFAARAQSARGSRDLCCRFAAKEPRDRLAARPGADRLGSR